MATAEKKRTPNTRQSTETQPALLAPDAFAAALAGIPSEDWSRTWAANRTIALRRTSKKVREEVDKMRLPAVVCLSRSFWDDSRNGTGEAKVQFVWRQLAAMTARCLITTLALPKCDIRENVEQLAGLLAQCPALAHLDLRSNNIPQEGACELAGVLGQCSALTHLNLGRNRIGELGTGRLAGVLAQCSLLAHLDLSMNFIGCATLEIIGGVLAECTVLTHLNLREIGSVIAGRRALQR
jgi:hypothetical protein